MDTTSETPEAAPSPPLPPPAPRRRLVRRVDDRVVAGVASGLGDYFNVDPVLFLVAGDGDAHRPNSCGAERQISGLPA